MGNGAEGRSTEQEPLLGFLWEEQGRSGKQAQGWADRMISMVFGTEGCLAIIPHVLSLGD